MGGKHFLSRASWTLVDQCVVSGGNFLLNVLLARTLSQEDYGEFALFLGAIFLLRAVDYSFISYPLSVRLCVVDDQERPRLLGNITPGSMANWSRCLAWMRRCQCGRGARRGGRP